MPRDKYISDHLVDMRAHLMRNYEKLHSNSTGEEGDSAAPENETSERITAVAADDNAPQAEKRLPSLVRSSDAPVDRERREFEGRVLHDLAMIESYRDLLKEQLSEVEKYHSVLEKEYQLLQNLNGQDDRGALAGLYLENSAASGRCRAFLPGTSAASPSGEPEKKSSGNSGNRFVGIAIIAGSIIVSLAMIFLFG